MPYFPGFQVFKVWYDERSRDERDRLHKDDAMAWETRGSRVRAYYFSAYWVDGRCRKVYHGTGILGAIAADVVDEAHLRRAQEVEALRAEQARLEGPQQALRKLEEESHVLLSSVLVTQGYRRSSQGSWRRPRDDRRKQIR